MFSMILKRMEWMDEKGIQQWNAAKYDTIYPLSYYEEKRCRRMERLGRMTNASRAVLPDMSEKGFVVDKDILNALQTDAEVWEKFQSFPPLYQRVRIDTIQIKKKQPELFQSRLQKLLDNTKAGGMYGEWNDNGRLFTV